ncbi:MAG: enoyl-CoA hydratase [Candidatus Palauibacterales bacterium]|nr:enoyl-CoA hydratase [Candidatus Palauibacterales bacterium]MDP2529723.1 enoyl-CoA hydratase [Candidatus Palauibacterales bacterium]MDP2584432.1 enoyl-CoA hydratase [Candidatus Palauibacterales bacterium]
MGVGAGDAPAGVGSGPDAAPGAEHILVEVDGPIGRVTLNRPDKLNAFVGDMRDRIGEVLERLGGDEAVRVVVVTGAGRAFCAGADVRYMTDMVEEERFEEARALVEAGRRVTMAITRMPKPVIAALNGPAAGGGANLALACDLRIASERASIGQTFNRIGLHPDWGGTWFLPRLVGPARAAELFFLADMVDAAEAERIGLVNRVVPHERLEAEVEELAERLAAKPALPIRLAKEALRQTWGSDLEAMLDFEVRAQDACFRSSDAREGVRAFVEKRPARFGRRSSGPDGEEGEVAEDGSRA